MNNAQAKQPVIFCDFDGTITETDNIVEIFRHFQPQGWDSLSKQIIERKLSIKQGLEQLIALFPSSQKNEIVAFIAELATVRRGFRDFLSYTRKKNIPFYVTSGGFDFIIEPVLSEYAIPRENIYCNHGDFSQDTVCVTWPHPCDRQCPDDCGMCKSTIIRSFPQEKYTRIMIGDGLTDFAGARYCDLIFARSHLIDICRKAGLNYSSFEDFFDILQYMQNNSLFNSH